MDATTPIPGWQKWTGRVLSGLVAFVLLSSGVNVFLMTPPVAEGFARNGYPESTGPAVGAAAFVSALLYCIPRTAVLGAILMTAYLGGAVATHVRIQDPFFWPPIVLGVLVWLGLVLRNRQVRAVVLPWRT